MGLLNFREFFCVEWYYNCVYVKILVVKMVLQV